MYMCFEDSQIDDETIQFVVNPSALWSITRKILGQKVSTELYIYIRILHVNVLSIRMSVEIYGYRSTWYLVDILLDTEDES